VARCVAEQLSYRYQICRTQLAHTEHDIESNCAVADGHQHQVGRLHRRSQQAVRSTQVVAGLGASKTVSLLRVDSQAHKVIQWLSMMEGAWNSRRRGTTRTGRNVSSRGRRGWTDCSLRACCSGREACMSNSRWNWQVGSLSLLAMWVPCGRHTKQRWLPHACIHSVDRWVQMAYANMLAGTCCSSQEVCTCARCIVLQTARRTGCRTRAEQRPGMPLHS
jgi:hypothetical protein